MRWTSRRNKQPWHFLTVSSQDIGLLSAEHERPTTPSKDHPEVDNASESFLSTLRPAVSTGLLDDCTSVERQLFQYCESEKKNCKKKERKLINLKIYRSFAKCEYSKTSPAIIFDP